MRECDLNSTRIQFTVQEIEAIRSLAWDKLRNQKTAIVADLTLGWLLIKTARASDRLKTIDRLSKRAAKKETDQ